MPLLVAAGPQGFRVFDLEANAYVPIWFSTRAAARRWVVFHGGPTPLSRHLIPHSYDPRTHAHTHTPHPGDPHSPTQI